MQPERNTSPPLKELRKTSSSGAGMSKNSPYISSSSITSGCGMPRAIGWVGSTVQTSSRSCAARHPSVHVVPIRVVKILEVPGVEHDQAHPGQHVPVHPLDDLVPDLVVRRVPPPGEYVGLLQHLLGQTVLGVVQPRCPDDAPVAELLAMPRAIVVCIPSG